jgi:hypothetical protein
MRKIFIATLSVLITTVLWAQTPTTMKPINNNAPVKCTKTIVINAAPQKVWQVLTDINNWPTWQPNVSKAILNGTLQPGTTFYWKADGFKLRSTLHTVQPAAYLGWTGNSMGLFAIHNWTLEETPQGTRITVEESMEGLLGRLFKKYMNKMLEKGMINMLNLLKTESEK